MDLPDDRAPRLVRLFPDHAGTVLWLNDPVHYADFGLGAGLVAALMRWETAGGFGSGAAALAEPAAVELGHRHEVGYAGFEGGIPRRAHAIPRPGREPGCRGRLRYALRRLIAG